MLARRECQHDYDATVKSNAIQFDRSEDDDFEQFKELVKKSGVQITFTDCSDLRGQCARVRLEHMMEEMKEKARLSREPNAK